MRITLLRLIPVLLLALAACDTGRKDDSAAPEGEAVAKVNGEALTESRLLHYAIRRAGGDPSALEPQVMQQLLNELINIELLAQEARKQDLHQQPPLQEQLAFQRDTALADAAMTRHLEQNPITDEEVRAEYEQRKGELGGTEYKARHILLEDEEKARDVIEQLDQGAEFAVLAKEHSVEPGAAESGGDLGWFSPAQMVPAFSGALSGMKPGERSKEPVQTQFGWHVILVEDAREIEPPPFEDVEEQIRRFLTNQRIQAYLNELRAKAEISQSGISEEEMDLPAEETPQEPAEESTPEA